MPRTQFFRSVDSAIKGLRQLDREYVIVDHYPKKWDEVEEHDHPVTEYLILGKGFDVCGRLQLGKKYHDIRLTPKEATVITIPKRSKHSFKVFRPIQYTVMRKT